MWAVIAIYLFQFASGRPQGQFPQLSEHALPQPVPPVIPIEIWDKYESHIPKEYYEIGKHDAHLRSSFWQAALRRESGPYFELGQILLPGWLGFVPTSVRIENNYTVQLPGGGVGHYISGTFEGPNGVTGSFGSSSSEVNAGGMMSSGMSWSTFIQPGQSQVDCLENDDVSEASTRGQNAFISQTEGDGSDQVANINQQGSNNRRGQSAGINQSGSKHGQTASITQGGPSVAGHEFSSVLSPTQTAGIHQAAIFGQNTDSHGSGYSQLTGLNAPAQIHAQHGQTHGAGYSQLSGLNSAQVGSTQQNLHAGGQIHQTGTITAHPGYDQLTGLNQAAGINQYQYNKPDSISTNGGNFAQSTASSSSSSASSSTSNQSSSNTHSNTQSSLGQLQTAGINTLQGNNVHNGYNEASGNSAGPNNYNGPNSGSVAHLYGRPQDSVSIIGPSSPQTGSAGSIHVNV